MLQVDLLDRVNRNLSDQSDLDEDIYVCEIDAEGLYSNDSPGSTQDFCGELPNIKSSEDELATNGWQSPRDVRHTAVGGERSCITCLARSC